MTMPKIYELKTSLSHKCYGLVKVSYALFAVFFIYCFSEPGWFSVNLTYVGLPIILVFLLIAHLIQVSLESKISCRIFSFIFKGRPPVFYLNWVKLVDCDTAGSEEQSQAKPAFVYGLKRIKLDLIDGIDLSIWGNLLIKSSCYQGSVTEEEQSSLGPYEADVIAKVPVGAASLTSLKEFVEAVRDSNPSLNLNKRLSRKLESKIVKGEELIKTLGAAFLLLVLLDLGYSTSHFLEMQKHYYLSSAVHKRADLMKEFGGGGDRKAFSESEFAQGERLFKERFPISLVQRALFDHGSAAGGVWQARAEALWSLGRRKDAIASLAKAHELYPKSLKLMIELARWKVKSGDLQGSRKVLSMAMEEHGEDLLPCLYMIAADKKDTKSGDVTERSCRSYLKVFDENVFGEEPWWPPGGNRFMSERFYREDLLFLSESLLNMDLDHSPQP